jgi:hypothetical protein
LASRERNGWPRAPLYSAAADIEWNSFALKRKRKKGKREGLGKALLLLVLLCRICSAQLVKQPHECLTLVNDRARRLIYEQINQNGEEFWVSSPARERKTRALPRTSSTHLSCR